MQGIINCISLLERSCKHCALTRCFRSLLLRSDGEYRNGEQISACMCIHTCYIVYICDIIYGSWCPPPSPTYGTPPPPCGVGGGGGAGGGSTSSNHNSSTT